MSSIGVSIQNSIPDIIKKNIPAVDNVKLRTISDFIYYVNLQTKDFVPFIIIFGLVYFTSYQIYLGLYYSDDNNQFNDDDFIKNVTKYVFLIFVPVFLLFCYIIHLTFDKQTEYSLFIFFIIFSIIAIVLYFTLSNITIDFSFLTNYTMIALTFIILIVGLMIIYNIFEKHIRSMDNWIGFTVNLIFYIPCMIDIFFKYMLENYVNTPNWILILFVCEIILILIYIYIIPTIRAKMMENAVVLLDKPVMLNEIHTELTAELKKSFANKLVNPEYLNENATKIQNILETSAFRKQYAISMWVYVNPMSFSRIGYTKESNIFYYGHDEIHDSNTPASYHPKLSLKPVEDKYQFAIYYAGNEQKQLIDLPFQKWNNLVFNYREGGVDLFVNGELNYSYSYATDRLPDYTDMDTVVTGDNSDIKTKDGNLKHFTDSNGLYGAICNVVYHKNTLSKAYIIHNYNQLHFLNPPVSP